MQEKDMQEKNAPGQNLASMPQTEEEWKKKLTSEQYRILREKGTEAPFTGELLKEKRTGMYNCAACGQTLFSSDKKFDSGTGWPSFWEPVAPENVKTETDSSWFMRRVEVLCASCEAHLGHVFDDGPAPTGLRYCMNSVALKLVKNKEEDRP